MTNQEILDNYIKQIEEAIKTLKSDIDTFFEENKSKQNLYYLLNEKFSDRITAFTNKYNSSYPEIFADSDELKTLSIDKTLMICGSLIHYLDSLMETLRKNKGQTPSS
ncbi:hypothetical protein D3C87_74420 [compost metagenome]